MVLDIRGLTVRRDAVIAVENVSFSLQSETATALAGPNGAGKSTQVQASHVFVAGLCCTWEVRALVHKHDRFG
jgi:ABC-type Mn2+/Zn2+ transport system ATPase subunit